MKILISGASIAGPALAYWLARDGHQVTVIEKAPSPRPGGQAVDFRGDAHRTVLERMDILEDVRRLQTGGYDMTIIDGENRPKAVIPGEFHSGNVEIRRGDLANLLYERTEKTCEYIFGDSITSLTDTGTGVHVTFERTAPRTVDLVVGADGIHSNVRRLAFGPESDYVRHLGHYYALAEFNKLDEDGEPVMYNEPGRMVAIGGTKSGAFFVFASPELTYDRYDADQQKKLLADAYRGGGWRIPELLEHIPNATDFYLDSVSRVHLDHYAKGRVVLLGDAAYGNTLGGFGTGLAIVGAYVLSGELLEAGGDHRVAFERYETALRSYASVHRRSNAGAFLAPHTPMKIRLRNLTFKSGFLLRAMLKLTDRFASRIDLKNYQR